MSLITCTLLLEKKNLGPMESQRMEAKDLVMHKAERIFSRETEVNMAAKAVAVRAGALVVHIVD